MVITAPVFVLKLYQAKQPEEKLHANAAIDRKKRVYLITAQAAGAG